MQHNNYQFLHAAKARTEAKTLRAAELQERLGASTILHPDEVGGDYDADRMLMTTLGGQVRPITIDDLKSFQRYVSGAKDKFKGGISARQVINHSRQEDRDRANQQIHTAAPVQTWGDVVHFQTNAGPDSDVERHHVFVEFMSFSAAVASPEDSVKAAKRMLAGKIKFDCDCGRHRFWYRFIATIGQFNFGRAETGYPKIRNPELIGVACKHTLRVMQIVVGSMTFRDFAKRMIERGRETLDKKLKMVKKAEMHELAEKIGSERSRNRKIESAEEKKRKRSAQPAEVARADAREKKRKEYEQQQFNTTAQRHKKIAQEKAALSKDQQKQYNEARKALNTLVRLGHMSAEDADTRLTEITGKLSKK